MTGMAFGVDRDTDGKGLDALTLRRIIRSKWNNTGIVTGLVVTGRSDLKYNVAAGMAACSMSEADGYTEAYWGGGTTENAVSAGDGTYSRIDTVYMISNTGTPDNRVHVLVAQGTPSATPAKPTLPSGGLELQSFTVPAGLGQTSSSVKSGFPLYAIPFGGNLGQLGYAKVTADYTVQEDNKWHAQVDATFTVPTTRQVNIEWKACSRITGEAGGDNANLAMGSYYLKILLDGKEIGDINKGGLGNCEEFAVTRYFETKTISYDISVPAGTHKVVCTARGNPGPYTYPVQFIQQRQVRILDRGLSQ